MSATADNVVALTTTPKPPPRKTARLYDKAWAVFVETPSKNAVARSLKIDWRTAAAIVDAGFPSFGLDPLRERYAQFMRGVASEADALLTAHRVESLQQLHAVRSKALGLLQRELTAIEGRTTKGVVGAADRLFGMIERSIKLEQHLLGDADVRVEHRHDDLDGLSQDELAAIILG